MPKTSLTSSSMFICLIISFFLPICAYAGDYLGDYCWKYNDTTNDSSGLIKLGIDHIGGNHFICSGVIYVQNPISLKIPTSGNIEFIDNSILCTLSLNGIRNGKIGIQMIKIELDPSTLNGNSESFGAYADATESSTGTVIFTNCN